MGLGGQSHTPAPLPREIPSTHCIGGWVGLRASLERCGKFHSHRDSFPGPLSLQRVAIHHVTKSNGDEGSVVDSALQ